MNEDLAKRYREMVASSPTNKLIKLQDALATQYEIVEIELVKRGEMTERDDAYDE